MARFSEQNIVVYPLKPGDHNAGVDGDSINSGKVFRVIYMIALAALTGDAVLKLFSGATAGTKTTAETFRYRVADAVQGSATADTFAAWATSAALTLTAATYQNRMLIVEIDSDELTDGQQWQTLEIGSEASAFNAAVCAMGAPRHEAVSPPTVIS